MLRSRVPGWAIVVAALVAVVLVRQGVIALRDRADERPVDVTTRAGNVTTDRYQRPVIVGRIQNPAVTESSGLAASSTNTGVLWTHNDSGDEPLIYCVTLRGVSCGTWGLSGAAAIDWEDIAIGPGPRAGTDYLYIGDIGDNDRDRDRVTIYRAPEPKVQGNGSSSEPLPAEAIELHYPDGPHDAETLMVHPDTGDLYIVTKELSSSSVVFKASAPVVGGDTLEAVGRIRISGFLSDRTGGDISPDGTRVVLCTYGAAYEMAVPKGGPFDDIWDQTFTEIDIGAREQGEAITYSADGKSLFATSEGAKPPLYQIVLKER